MAVAAGERRTATLLSRPVHAGFPSPADDFAEGEIDLSELLVANRPATFVLRVAGDSVAERGLFDGDLAIVDRSLTPMAGDLVVVDVEGDRSFKVWGGGPDRDGAPRLSFANARYPAFVVPRGASVEVWGVVASSIHPQRPTRARLGDDAAKVAGRAGRGGGARR